MAIIQLHAHTYTTFEEGFIRFHYEIKKKRKDLCEKRMERSKLLLPNIKIIQVNGII